MTLKQSDRAVELLVAIAFDAISSKEEIREKVTDFLRDDLGILGLQDTKRRRVLGDDKRHRDHGRIQRRITDAGT